MTIQTCTIAGTKIIVDRYETVSYGANRIIHQYPGGLTPMVETLGQRPTIFEIEGSLDVNDNGLLGRALSAIMNSDAYQDLTDLMEEMADTSGALIELVHPSLGSWYGTILQCPFSESKERLGIVQVRLTFFAHSKTSQQKTSIFQTVTNVITGSQASGIGTIGAAFNTAMQAKNLLGTPASALTTVGASVTSLISRSTGLTNSISGIDSLFGGAATLGRFAQTSSVPSDITSTISTSQSAKAITSDVTTAMVEKISDNRRTISGLVSDLVT